MSQIFTSGHNLATKQQQQIQTIKIKDLEQKPWVKS